MKPVVRPLAVALFFCAGVLAGESAGMSPWVWAACSGAGAVALAVAAVMHRRLPRAQPGEVHPALSPGAAALVLAGCALVASGATGLRMEALERASIPNLDGEVVSIKGRVASDPGPSGRASKFLLRAEKAGGIRVREKISVRVFGSAPPVELGDRVRIEAKIKRLDLDQGWARSLYRKGVVAEATASANQLRVVGETRNHILSAANSIRAIVNDLAAEALGGDEAGLVLGLTIGDERMISEEVKRDFRSTNLSHLTAVSGANVAMVLGAVVLLLRGLRVSRRAQIVVGFLTIGFFALVTRGEPSVLRASVMAALALAAFLFGRRHDPVHGLILAFVGLLAVDPFLLWSVGFQLSFAAAAGILVLTPRLLARFYRLPRLMAEALAVGIAAQAAVAPLLAFHFGTVSLIGIPANLAAFGLVAPITILGLAGALAGAVWRPAGMVLLEIAGPFAALLRRIAAFFASIPGASVDTGDLSFVHIVAAYLLLSAGAVFFFGRRRIARYPAALAVALWAWGGLMPAVSPSPNALRATFFDVGQGDSAFIDSSGGARILVDGGPSSGVVSDLERLGIRRIDLVVLSHAHSDHIDGLGPVLGRFSVRKIIEPGVPDERIVRALNGRAATVAGAGDRFVIGDLTIDVLGPDNFLRSVAIDESREDLVEGSSLNDASLVLRVSKGSSCILLTGDLEVSGQEALLERYRRQIECSVMKAPHHGSARIVRDFVEAVRPRVVVVSVGPNDYGHPTRSALSMFEDTRARVLRTDRMGDITVDIGDNGAVAARGSSR